MTNDDIAGVLENIAGLLEIKGENAFKIRAYRRAARSIGYMPAQLEQMVAEGRSLRGISGVGEAIAEKVRELVTAGRLEYYERLRAEFPDGVLTLMDVPGIGPRTANRVCSQLGVTTVEGLERAIVEGRVAALPRMGQRAADNILRHLRALRTKDRRVPLGVALPVAQEIVAELRSRCPDIGQLAPAGSLRRRRDTVGDIDLMGTAREPDVVIREFARLPVVTEVLGHGPKKASVLVRDGLQVDLRIVPASQFGSLIQYFTGSRQHNVLLREYASRRGLSLNEYGITVRESGELLEFPDEEGFYARLGLPAVPPELREGMGEVEAAQRGELPRLVQPSDVKGDLHAHTTESDGRDTLEAMVDAARGSGLHYLAITEHSAGRGIANGLSVERLRAHVQRVREADAGLSDLRLLAGAEVDIRADGSLDYPDEVLEELDIVVASVHSAMDQRSDRMTARVIAAMENPNVHVIGHLTCRLLGSRVPVEIDVEEVLQAARRTGTAMEINSQPQRLDLKDTHARRARELGVPVVISSDAHSVDGFAQLPLGVAVARRAWCEPGDVLNTRPPRDLLGGLKPHP